MMEDLYQVWQELSPKLSEESKRQKGDDIDEVQEKLTKLSSDVEKAKSQLLGQAGLRKTHLEEMNSISNWIATTKDEVDQMETNIENEDYSDRCEVYYIGVICSLMKHQFLDDSV
jgi:DNA repair exonuclease SbcCD ATPase subunit